MTEAKHTQGPWGLDDKTDSITWGNVEFGAPIGAGGFVVASHSICKIPRHQSERLTDEHKANARLIVAAPDMLAALQKLVAQMVETLAYEYALKGEDAQLLADVEAAEAAIAKAKGIETPPSG